MKAKVRRESFPAGRRIIAVSDIHGNYEYFSGLLKKLSFSPEDILVIPGDMVDKGPDSLSVLRLIMHMCEAGNVYPLCGNCDCWHELFDRTPVTSYAGLKTGGRLRDFLCERRRGSLIAQMCGEVGFEISSNMDMGKMLDVIREPFRAEFDFLRSLPTIIDTEYYTFVHGGLPGTDLDDLEAHSCMKFDDFLSHAGTFDKWCIVGHWPVMLYGQRRTQANPIIDTARHIVSIDGGCCLKDDGQLNALIIPEYGNSDFGFEYYDPFPLYRVVTPQTESSDSFYIRWGDNVVRVLDPGTEFSRCMHVRTGYVMDILTKFLRRDGDTVTCNDCTDYEPGLSSGDIVALVEETSRGYMIKHNGVSGWYRGTLEAL